MTNTMKKNISIKALEGQVLKGLHAVERKLNCTPKSQNGPVSIPPQTSVGKTLTLSKPDAADKKILDTKLRSGSAKFREV